MPFNEDFTWKKKSHGVRSNKSDHWDLAFCEKCLNTEETVCWCVVLVKNP